MHPKTAAGVMGFMELSALKEPVVSVDPASRSDPESFYRTVLESLSEAVLLAGADRRIFYANRLATELTGYAPEELLGRPSHELFHFEDHAQATQCQSKDPLSDQTEILEKELKGKDGRLHWVLVRTTPYRNQHKEIVGRVIALSCLARQKCLEFENEVLQDDIRQKFGHIVGNSLALQKVLAQISTVALTEANVLILGESGTGKELVAHAIHDLSARKGHPLVRVNCASIPKELFESEFFGHVRGAFTGAIKDRAGRFELADGGTLFLDEIGEIPPDLQSKLLRVLQEGQFERVGDDRTRTVKVRLIAATNRDLLTEARAGRFRLDLYYRLSVFPVEVPPLRERLEDIGPLAEHFIGHSARRLGVPRPRLTKLHVQELQSYDWPGNVRELQNIIERAVILARGGRLQLDLPPRGAPRKPEREVRPPPAADGDEELSLEELVVREREIVVAALRRTHGKIYGPDGAAALLRCKPTTLVSKMKRLKVRRDER
ncbi:MAG: sigma 54-interacting transcriptional regulator [Opitutaceae bacterium]|nr:sigma 54-interacting transcriptional regulator [Opitutaceae bacterium]